jgi:hypothetical protein
VLGPGARVAVGLQLQPPRAGDSRRKRLLSQ